MKSTRTIIYICLILTVLNVFAFLFFACKSHSGIVTPPVTVASGEALVYSEAYMPENITFAGEKVPLHRQDVEEAFRKELIVNSNLHSHTIQILQTAPRMFEVIEPILKKNGIPDDFKYLAVIESRLDPLAVSPAGAVGVWQFLKGTGKEHGLEINNEIDERYHIEKSTEAAADYLKKAYEKFGSWTLAAASYNAGRNMILKQMDIQKESDYYDLLLGEETGRYVFRILALKQIMNHPERYNFKVNTIYPVEKTETVEVKGAVENWADFAREQGITYKTLKRFNPWLRKNDLKNPQGHTYKIPNPKQKDHYK